MCINNTNNNNNNNNNTLCCNKPNSNHTNNNNHTSCNDNKNEITVVCPKQKRRSKRRRTTINVLKTLFLIFLPFGLLTSLRFYSFHRFLSEKQQHQHQHHVEYQQQQQQQQDNNNNNNQDGVVVSVLSGVVTTTTTTTTTTTKVDDAHKRDDSDNDDDNDHVVDCDAYFHTLFHTKKIRTIFGTPPSSSSTHKMNDPYDEQQVQVVPTPSNIRLVVDTGGLFIKKNLILPIRDMKQLVEGPGLQYYEESIEQQQQHQQQQEDEELQQNSSFSTLNVVETTTSTPTSTIANANATTTLSTTISRRKRRRTQAAASINTQQTSSSFPSSFKNIVCEFQHTTNSFHYPHAMEQLYRCISWWFHAMDYHPDPDAQIQPIQPMIQRYLLLPEPQYHDLLFLHPKAYYSAKMMHVTFVHGKKQPSLHGFLKMLQTTMNVTILTKPHSKLYRSLQLATTTSTTTTTQSKQKQVPSTSTSSTSTSTSTSTNTNTNTNTLIAHRTWKYSPASHLFYEPNDAYQMVTSIRSHYQIPTQTGCSYNNHKQHYNNNNNNNTSSFLFELKSKLPRIGILNRNERSKRSILNIQNIINELQILYHHQLQIHVMYPSSESNKNKKNKNKNMNEYDTTNHTTTKTKQQPNYFRSYYDEISFLSSIDILISPHGGQLTAIPFLLKDQQQQQQQQEVEEKQTTNDNVTTTPTTTTTTTMIPTIPIVVELIPKFYYNSYYWTLANTSGIKHYALYFNYENLSTNNDSNTFDNTTTTQSTTTTTTTSTDHTNNRFTLSEEIEVGTTYENVKKDMKTRPRIPSPYQVRKTVRSQQFCITPIPKFIQLLQKVITEYENHCEDRYNDIIISSSSSTI